LVEALLAAFEYGIYIDSVNICCEVALYGVDVGFSSARAEATQPKLNFGDCPSSDLGIRRLL